MYVLGHHAVLRIDFCWTGCQTDLFLAVLSYVVIDGDVAEKVAETGLVAVGLEGELVVGDALEACCGGFYAGHDDV